MASFQQSLRPLVRSNLRCRASRNRRAIGVPLADGASRRLHHRSPLFASSTSSGATQEMKQGPPPPPSGDAPCRLGLGGHQLSKADPHKYLRIVRSALENGMRTIEAPSSSSSSSSSSATSMLASEPSADDKEAAPRGGGDGEEVLASTLRSLLQENPSFRSIPIEVLVRIGYETKEMSRREPGDLLVEALAPNDRSDAKNPSTKEGSRFIVVHNLTGTAVQRRLEGSSLSGLSQDFRNVRIVPLLHNPEQQASRRELDAEPLQRQLQESFSNLEALYLEGAIGRFGMVSNGLCLPRDHPLHLPAEVPVDAANQFTGYQVTQLPLNALEIDGIAVARQLAERIDPSRNHEVYAMRPLACYPNRGTGAGHPFVLADLLIPEFVAGVPVIGGGNGDDSDSGGAEASAAAGSGSKAAPPQLRWTNELPDSVPAAYESALKVSMQYFDAEELVQAKLDGQTLTAEQRETLDGCKLLQSLFHDLDAGLSKQRSMAAHEQYLTETVIPLIHDTFESYDEESAQVLENFFAAYTVAVRHAVAKNTRALLQGGEESAQAGGGGGRGSGGEQPPAYTIPSSMRLQEFGLRFVLEQPNISKVIVGASEIDQVVENVQIAWKAQTSTLEMEVEGGQ